MKTLYAWNASKFIHVEFLRHPNVAKFLSVCFPEFQTHEWHPSSCPCGFLQLLWTFSTLLFSFPGNGPLLEAVKRRKAIVITINQTKLLTVQYIEHQKECFSRFPNMPCRRSRKRCALELLLSGNLKIKGMRIKRLVNFVYFSDLLLITRYRTRR